ncbi:TolC family protein [Adhaeribacter terrigena]|uniref:TolC family protein n=1 Tax=Adhaeribacter terrigena TaxID=2793070 RepID=UPI00293D24D6|nr:TolC family protein [Adhaeribacter terrigena]
MKKKFIAFGLLLSLAGPAFSQSQSAPVPLTLQESVKYALQNNEAVKKAYLDEKSAAYRIKEVTGSGLPQLNATGTLTMNPALATQLLPGELAGAPGTMIPVQFGTKYVASAGISLQQLIFNKSFFVGLEAAKTTKDLYRLRTQMSEEEVIYNVSSAYLQLLQTREQFNTIDANFKRLEQLEKILDLQYKNDVATKVQLNRVTVNKVNLENTRQTLEANYVRQLNALKFFMGMPVDQPITIADTTPTLNVPVLAKEDASSVLYNRIDFQLLNKQKQLLNLNEKNIKARYYPSLSGFGNVGTSAQRNEFTFFNTNQPWFNNVAIGLQLNVPIFDGFQRRNQVKQAKIEIEKVEQDIAQVTNATNMSLQNAATQMQSSLSAVQAQERNVTLAQEVYRNTNELYKEGLTPLTDLLDTEVSLREAQTNLNNERLKYQLAQLTYLQAKGELKSLVQ